LKAIASALRGTRLPLEILILHVLLGHKIELISQFLAATNPKSVILWLHDYSTICSGYNLLRNDLQFCAAPPNTSTACRVCVYGADRPWHLNSLAKLFEVSQISVVSPSEAAMRIWWEGKHVDPEAAYIVPHWTLTDIVTSPSIARRERRNGFAPLRIAFVGYPKRHKGWHIYEEIVHSSKGNPSYEFFHLASPGFDTRDPAVNFVPVEVTPDNRFGMVQTLRDNDIDVVVNASVWPETFSYVTYECLAAGALVFALTVSGNVGDVIENTDRGRLFEKADDLVTFFATGEALEFYNSRPEARIKTYSEISITGTTAALIEESVI
jgi:glycosyltransferase involved in cell wall biosynthesis